MFGKTFVSSLISRSASNPTDRRVFLKAAGLAGLGAVGAGLVSSTSSSAGANDTDPITDAAVLNFALNLEYLEAEFYLRAVTGAGLPDSLTTGPQPVGGVTGGTQVPWKDNTIRAYAREIANDERNHVAFLRAALGSSAVSRPTIDLQTSFTNAAIAAGVISAGETFDPFADDQSFLLGAFLFEDVGVTAYKGAAPLISNATYLEAAAGILAVEAYHAGLVRTSLYERGLGDTVQKLSDARDFLDGAPDQDQGILNTNQANIVPADKNSIAYSRTTGQVLNIVYLTPDAATSGGFYPSGVYGDINESRQN